MQPSHGQPWYAFLPAFIAVTGLAAGYAEAQSNALTVEAVSFAGSPAQRDTYELGEKIEVAVRFDRSVEWYEGRVELALAVGDHIRLAQARSISFDGRDLRFAYTVGAEDRDGDGISISVNALSLDAGTITDRAGTNFTEIANAPVPADAGHKVDGSRGTAPRISDINHQFPSRGRTYRRGDRIEVTVAFDRAVRVTGVPQLVLIYRHRDAAGELPSFRPPGIPGPGEIRKGGRQSIGGAHPAHCCRETPQPGNGTCRRPPEQLPVERKLSHLPRRCRSLPAGELMNPITSPCGRP